RAPRSLLAGGPGDLYALPPPEELPVLVAVRMSLSFPGLLSAIPLYGADHVGKEPPRLQHCWFSDGGLISNFPIHFFDKIWPRCPTYAFDLCGTREGFPEQVWLTDIAEDAELPMANVTSVADFAGALINAMQSWSDNTHALLPGYRERIAHIGLNEDEGGLHLEMKPETIQKLARQGESAAKLFQGFDWNQHRWTRFLSSMSEFREVLVAMRTAFREPNGEDPSLVEFLRTYPLRAPHFTALNGPWLERASQAAGELVDVIDQWEEAKAMDEGPVPAPPPQLRVTPRY
ncbi:MAG TPA: patatin-like phospholipase family protein, partial [Polyangiaceae bacterium]